MKPLPLLAGHRPTRAARPRRTQPRHRAALAGLLAALFSMGLAAPAAHGACRSTTCTGECARDADGCKTDGHQLWWDSMCVSFSIQREGSVNIPYPDVERIVVDAFVAWSDLPCGVNGEIATMAFSRAADVACHCAEYNQGDANANVVMFQDYKWSYTSANNTLAKATVTYDNDTGEILDADIELNHAFNEFTIGDVDVAYDLQSILTHEIGHLVGLDHSFSSSATMNAGYSQGSTALRTLDPDDIDGVCAAYPPGRDAQCITNPKGGLADECVQPCGTIEDEESCGCRTPGSRRGATTPGGGLEAWWLLALAGSAATARRRRRTR